MSTAYLAPQQHRCIMRDFQFHSGETLPELTLHVTTLGAPTGLPVLVLHGTAGSGASLLTPEFAGELFGSGQPLDAAKYFIILPDALGAGQSSKPSDGLRMAFPRYDYQDMVQAQYRMVTEHFGVQRLHLILGHSMGGMHAWMWGCTYPQMMDALVPMACMPSPMAGRNWMMRRFVVDSIQRDPAWMAGHYLTQPPSAQFASVYAAAATSGGHAALVRAAPSADAADAWLDAKLHEPFVQDANDLIYQWQASRHYDPSPALHTIQARVLAINAADDERNPPHIQGLDERFAGIDNATLFVIAASEHTCGHGSTLQAIVWKQVLIDFLAEQPSCDAPAAQK